MKTRSVLAVSLLFAMGGAFAQVAVDADGQPFDESAAASAGDDGAALFTAPELSELVAPIALYPDDLLAIVLPASTYPLQLVEASRFLKALEQDSSLEPDADWDDTVVALLNYPEVIELLNDDLDWTWQLGEAVVTQEDDVIGAVEAFRDRAYAAGNLKSDEFQQVSRDEGIIEIAPVTEDVIHVPYYEPERVVVQQPYPVYHYHAAPRPVYYYPYDYGHAFRHGYFWGVTTAFTIGWASDRLHVHHHSYRGHPYYGRRYYDRWWYRRPSIAVYQATYFDRRRPVSFRHYDRGDHWRSNRHVRMRLSNQRVTRTRYYHDARPARRATVVHGSQRDVRRSRDRRADTAIRRDDSDRYRRFNRDVPRDRQQSEAANSGQTRLDRERERNLDRQQFRRSGQQTVAQRRIDRPRQPSVAQRRVDRPQQPGTAQRRAEQPREYRRDSAIPRSTDADRTRSAARNAAREQRRERPVQKRSQNRESRANRAPKADRRERQRGRADRNQPRRERR